MKKNNSTFKWNLKKIPVGIIAMLCVIVLSINSSVAQTTVFSEDFNRGAVVTPLSNGGTPAMTWTTACSIGTNSGLSATNLNSLSDYSLGLQANGTTPTACREWVSGPLLTFLSPFNPTASTLSSNTAPITWTVNNKTTRSTAYSGFGAANYAPAIILAASSSDFTTGTGYAIIGSKVTKNNYKLVRYTGGIQGTQTAVISTASSELASNSNWASLKVVYNPSGNNWSLYFRDDANTTNPTDPTTGTLTQVGSTTSDATYTGTLLTHCGFYWNIGGTGSGSSNRGMFDNFKVVVDFSWTSPYPIVDTQTISGFTVKVNSNQIGNAYYVVLPSGAAAPTSAQVKAGQNAAGTALDASYKGTIACAAVSTAYSSAVSGLPTGLTRIDYDVYIVAENSLSNLQPSPTKVSTYTFPDLPLLSTPTVGTASSLTTSGFTANWTPVSNAVSYDVKVYNSSSALVSNTNASGQSASSVGITGLNASTYYTYTVTLLSGYKSKIVN